MADISAKCKHALTNELAFNSADHDTLAECWLHIHDAIRQVQAAQSAQDRKAMLAKLPSHIRARVEEWVKAFWGVEAEYVGPADLEYRVLPLAGITALVRKKGA